jgi:hypothetical protein
MSDCVEFVDIFEASIRLISTTAIFCAAIDLSAHNLLFHNSLPVSQSGVVAMVAHQKGDTLSDPKVYSPRLAHQLDNTLSDLVEEEEEEDMSIVEVVVPDNSEAGYYTDNVVEKAVHLGRTAVEVVEGVGNGVVEGGLFPVLRVGAEETISV